MLLLEKAFRIIVYNCVLLFGNYAQPEESCNIPMTSSLRDDQFSASSEYNVKHNASAARSSGEGWSAVTGGSSEYLQVDLEAVWRLTAIDVQGSNIGWYSRTFRISYSTDGYVWTGYNTRLSEDSLGELFARQAVVTGVTFDPPIKARYIAINPVSTYGYASLRIELYGCQSSDSSSGGVFTNIQSDIAVDTTWISSQSPILIDRYITVRSAAVLSVQAGVSVIFTKESARLDVYGTLSVEGIQGLPVLFSSDKPLLSAKSKWQGVTHGAGGYLNMTHVVIRQAVTGIQGNGSRMKIAHSEIHSCEHGIRIAGGITHSVSNMNMIHPDEMVFVSISSHDNRYGLLVHGETSKPDIPIGYSRFDTNEVSGIFVSNWDSASKAVIQTNLYVVDCSMNNNSNYGLRVAESILTKLFILNSTFIGNTNSGLSYYRYYQYFTNETVYIINSDFVENRNDGLNVYCYTCEPSTHVYVNNTFRGHTQEGMDISLWFMEGQTSNVTIGNSIFSRNRRDINLHIEKNGQAVIQNNYFEHSRIPVKLTGGRSNTDFAALIENTFTEHASTYDESLIEIDKITTSITNSTFANSSIPTLIRFISGFDHSFAYNRFINASLSSCFLSLGQEYEPNSFVNIDFNFWDTPDMYEIKTKICDFFFDSSRAVAKLDVFYPTIMMDTPTSASEIDDFRFVKDDFVNATVIGGVVKSKIELFNVGKDQIVVNRSILISDSASVNISGFLVHFANNRGIVVHGSLAIGKGGNYSSRTVLQHQGTGRWNGIDLYSSGIVVNNMDLFGTQRFLTVHGTHTSIVLQNSTFADNVLQNLVHADMLNGNLSVQIISTSVKSRYSTLYIKMNDTETLALQLTDSNFSSRTYVTELKETIRHSDIRHVNVDVSNCSMYASGYRVLYLASCSSHLTVAISGSNFSSVRYYDTHYFQFPSMDVLITENTFGETDETLYFGFCNRLKLPTNFSKVINITRNVFNSSRSGKDITIYKYYTNEQSHAIYVTNNVFEFKNVITRRRILSTGYTSSNGGLHTMVIDSNIFSNSTDRSIDLSLAFDKAVITNNVFANNTHCIYISSRQKMNTIEISDNIFNNNTLTDGVIFLDRIINNMTLITRNSFVNNTHTAIAFRSPDVNIKYNFFENGQDNYNLKVLPDHVHSSEIVNVSLNYWGTTNVKEIAKTIYDKDYDDTLFDVVFRPYLGSRNITDIRDEDASFVTSDGEVGGTVNGNVTLTIDRSPYLVVSNIEVGNTDILTIDAGVELLIKAGLGIKVFGQMNVLGTQDQPVKMLPEITGAPWRGVQLLYVKDFILRFLILNDTQEGLHIEGSMLNVQNVTSTYAQQSGLTLVVYDDKDISDQTNVRLSEVIVENNGWDGIRVTGISSTMVFVTIDNCVVSNNTQNGIRLETDAEIKLNNCVIKNNSFSGISLDQTGFGITYVNASIVTNNTNHAVEGNIAKGLVMSLCNVTKHNNGYYTYWGYWSTSSYMNLKTSNVNDTLIEFSNTHFRDNVADGIYISKSYYGGGKLAVNIENCSFSGGNRTLVLSDNSASWVKSQMHITFIHNTVEGNFLQDYRNSDLRLIKLVLGKQYSVEMKDNIFRNNTAETGLHIISRQMSNDSVTVRENRFIENNFSVTTVDVESYVQLKLQRNIFETQYDHDCIITAPTFDINFAINATYNFWGAATAKTVAKEVCGFEKDMGKSYIWYIPFYRDNELSETISLDPETLNMSGTFGGEVTMDVVISKNEFPTPIRIDRSIIIRCGAVLKIEAGIVLKFESNRGIYVQGSLNLLGGDGTIVLEKADNAPFWYGVMINSSQTSQDKTVIDNTKIQQTLYGVVVYSNNVDIKRSSILNSTSHCLTVYQSVAHRIYDFENSQVEACSDHGISVVGDGATTVMNVDIRLSKTGIGLNTRRGSVDIRSVNIYETTHAVSLEFTDRAEAGNITIEGCLFTNCTKGLTLSSQNSQGPNSIKLSRNTFENIASTTLDIKFSLYIYYYADANTNRTVDLSLNTFRNSCGITFGTWNNVNLTVHDNVFLDADCTDDSNCFLNAYAIGNYRYPQTRQFDISTNLFQNISSKCVVILNDNDLPYLHGNFVYNQMISNAAEKGVVVLDALFINISQNIFDNPDTSFDVYAYKRGATSVNVTNNWWGSSDTNHVYNRIFDQRLDPELVLFDVNPVLTERAIDCSGVNNCSSHGECVSPNRCRCYTGWTGESCMDYDCTGVSDCYGNGKCTGPNVCECKEGWSGKLCIVASCINVSSCSGHGICVRPDVCTCAAKFTGSDCSSCVPLHWGPQCRPCPDCKQGTCNVQNGLCECDGENWSGYLCDSCSETFYGPECLPLVKVLDIVPNQGRDKGGALVHVWGHNFPETSDRSYKCKFDTKETNGTWLAWNHIVCVTPQHPEGTVTVEISPDGQEYTNDMLMYFFYATCPPGSCGRDFNPSRGQCLFGDCSCFLPWTGENCDQELLAPVIIKPTFEQTVEESSTYSIQLNLLQGDPPIMWSLLAGPKGMTIDDRTGAVGWSYAYAESKPYEVQARARNIIGQDIVRWKLNVPISYTVSVESIEPSGIFPVPRPVQIYGTVGFAGALSQRVVPIDVIVTSARTSRETNIQELSDPLAPTVFKTTYFPRPDDAGLFIASARHPGANSDTSTNVTWSVLGMRCEPSSVTVNQKILSDDGTVTVSGISSLINIGNGLIANISAKVDGLPGAFVRKPADTGQTEFLLTELAADDNIAFDLVVPNAKPLSGTIYVVFSTHERTSTRLRIHIKLSILRPNLIFDPPSLHENVVRGNIRIFDVKINNTGEAAAETVDVSLPKDTRLSLVSFSVLGIQSSPDGGNTIPPGGAAQMSLAVTTENQAALGEMTGTIYINSELSSDPFVYRFYITSLEKFNVTFSVKDEYTYFAAGSPLVSNAKVTLVNPRRGYSETRITTNETGYVVFEDVYEDQYSLYAEADGHASYGAVILVTPDTTAQDIFLQRVAVKYTWTVEPTTVEDVYIIQLESTFETYVPMPVVTIEPAKVNTIPLELEETDTIDFNITNHGLIRADNVRFTLPTGHPYLNFEMTVDFIGSVEANTSIIVPIKATLKNRVKRNAAAMAVCGLALLYDYACGGTQTRNLDVTLTREYPGRPPLPCGLGGGGTGGGRGPGGGGVSYSNGGSGTGSGSSVTYNPTTPLSCDCAKTLIKSCALAFHPIAGCAIAVGDLGTSFARSNGNVVVGTLHAILGLADTAFACVFGVVCSLCGLFYTTIRCVFDVTFYCDGARRRRDISSEVVNNMLTTARPMDNFLHMMTEILGDEGMYNLESVWYPAFKKTVGEESELGTLLSNSEATSILNALTEEAAKANLSQFLERWNNTAAAWENGTLTELGDTSRVISLTRLSPRIEQYLIDIESAEAKGFDSIFDEFDHATNAYRTAEIQQSSSSGGSQKDEGVCARVRVRIVQELVLTRDAFNAKLEIENGESSDLESIKVEIQIRQTFSTDELTNAKFSIGEPTLIGISGVDGSGTLRRDLSGSAEWLIIPYSNAAPEDDTQYDIGGQLSYSVGGSEFSVPLLPDTITVKPNPSLVVHYFHEKYVRGDDALTPEVEPVIPFSLVVMVMNNGYGVARSLKITSGQPEIIENEKGLLITFKIIGAQLGSNPITPSLSVEFGDISSFETKTARWLMTSTLMGTFYNYSATFENINPLGDPQLSLLDELGYHELIHLVRIEQPGQDDGLDDFLVNDFVDGQGIPDRLYNSENGSDIVDVYKANITDVKLILFSSAKEYKFVRLTVKTNTSSWFYARIENTFTSADSADNENLLYAEAADGRELFVDKNVWQTTHILDTFYLHLLDFIANDSTGHKSTEIEFQYDLVYGPRNMYAPRFNSSSYTATISKSREAGFEVITVHAYDIDKDRIDFELSNENVTQFNISTIPDTAAVIVVNKTPLEPGLVILAVIARDSGIPSRSTSINVTIHVTDRDIAVTTQPTTVTNVTTSPSTNKTVTQITNSTVGSSPTVSSSTNVDVSSSTENATSSTSVISTSLTDSTNGTTSSSVQNTTTSSSVQNTTTSSSVQNTTTSSSVQNTTTSSSVQNTTTSSSVQNTTTSVDTDATTKKAVNTTVSSTPSYTNNITNQSSVYTSIKSTANATMTQSISSTTPANTTMTEIISSTTPANATMTQSISSTTTANGTRDEQEGEEVPRWVIPMSLGIFVLVIAVVAVVCALRQKP